MDRETIIKMAREANLLFPGTDQVDGSIEQLERFAKLVAEHVIKSAPDYKMGYADGVAVEREACAKFCETHQVWVGRGKRGFSEWGDDEFVTGAIHQGMDYAAAIRARSK